MPNFLVYPKDFGLTDTIKNGINPAVNTSLKSIRSECFMIVSHKDTGWKYGWDRQGTNIYALPCYPDSINESQQADWTSVSPLGRSSPLSAYTGTGYREISLNLRLHREMCNGDEAYIDAILSELRRAVYPIYVEKGLEPPITTFQFGQFKCKGYVRSISYNWQKPIIDGYYQLCDVSIPFVDVPDSVFSAKDLSSIPTNPFNRKSISI